MPLWEHQERYITRAREAFKAGKRAILLTLPTGAGKTVLASALCQSHFGKQGRILWIVHRIELMRQAADALRASGVPCGLISPDFPRTYEPNQVASIDTLIARPDLKLDPTMLVVDEAHHIVANTYFEVRRRFQRILTIGLTATPGRADDRGLGAAFDYMIAEVQPRELIDLGVLVPARVIGPAVAVDQLSAYPADLYRAKAHGRKAIAFCSSVKQAEDLAAQFAVAGYRARCVEGNMPASHRDHVLTSFARGEIDVLTNVMVLTEGYDCRDVSCIILASKVSSCVAYVQKTGRGLRSCPGKTDCIVLDLFGSSHALGMLPDSDREYSLTGKAVSARTQDLIELTQCQACGQVFPCGVFAGGVCPGCGWRRPPKPDPRVVRQEQIEIQQARLRTCASAQGKVQWLAEQLARSRGRTGGILVRFNKAFHHFPNHTQREASGMNAALAIEKAARERRTA